MNRTLIATAALLAAVPLAGAAPAADAAGAADAPCTPSITMGKPFQDPGGFVVFPASYTLCETSRVVVKFRDRDDSGVVGYGYTTQPAGPGTTYGGTCPAGAVGERRWAGYATIKTTTGTLLVKSTTVYLRSAPVKRNCTPYPA